MAFKFNPTTGELDITVSQAPVQYLHMQSPDDGSLWDAYINSAGTWVITPVIIVINHFLLENGDFFLLENGDKLILG